jgi:Mg/Co/Ni transporter MgtE
MRLSLRCIGILDHEISRDEVVEGSPFLTTILELKSIIIFISIVPFQMAKAYV